MTIDPEDRTQFKFGNGSKKTTLSRADITTQGGGKAGVVSMGCLDTGETYVPMLGSVEFLVRSGAIIDFGRALGIFQAISDEIVELERSSAGHLLVDLTEDLVGKPVQPSPAERAGLERLAE